MLDYLIKNGLIINGSGGDPFKSCLGVSGERITYIGAREIPARNIIDAEGLVVSPGFIDTHGHSEFTLLADGRAEGKLFQGITTEINGNCGLSAAPLYGKALEQREADLRELGIKERWHTFKEYFSILKNRGIGINFATLCGHGNIRASVLGYKDAAPDDRTIEDMKRLLSDALKDGAKGLSTGLIYPPGIYSDTKELVSLCRFMGRVMTEGSKGIYTSHMRSEGESLVESIEEVISIGKEADISVHISHIKTSGKENWGKIDKALELIENARSSGINLTCDSYPYIASSTDLDSILPSWVYEGGVQEELGRLKDPLMREKIKAELTSKSISWKDAFVASVITTKNKWMEGENIHDISVRLKKNPEEAVVDILLTEKARAGAIFFSMNEANLRRFLSLPCTMIGSDSSARSFSGITCSGKPHPRGFGAFPRFIGRYVRDEGIMPLSEAIKRIANFPAQTFGIKERGVIREGFYADIVIFDYKRIIDRAGFKYPFKKPEGILYVFVNGGTALKEGEITGSLSGRILR